MAMRPLLMGDEQLAMIRTLRHRAESVPPIDMAALVKTMKTSAGRRAHHAMMRRLTIGLEFGYTVTYSIENHHGVLLRHLSMAVDAPRVFPHPTAIKMILPQFGFVGTLERDTHVAKESLAEAGYYAINVIQPVDYRPSAADDRPPAGDAPK